MPPIVRHDRSTHDSSSAASGRERLAGIAANAASRTQLWTSFLSDTKVARVAEVGVWKGDFAAAILAACPSIGLYVMIDPATPIQRVAEALAVVRATKDGGELFPRIAITH